jgi:hypothetical protein
MKTMTKKDRDLLLKDLCARLTYGVKVQHNNKKEVFGVVEQIEAEGDIDLSYYDEETERWKLCCTSIDNIKPYLRSMSSMTEEEREEFRMIGGVMSYSPQHNTWAISAFSPEAYDWLLANHFDYRGLIEKGLALEAPEGMYK